MACYGIDFDSRSRTFRCLFPQLTMGLALRIVLFKSLTLRLRNESYNEVAQFCGRILALDFDMGAVTGIPVEFQFVTSWSRFSRFSGEVLRRGRNKVAVAGIGALVPVR